MKTVEEQIIIMTDRKNGAVLRRALKTLIRTFIHICNKSICIIYTYLYVSPI